MSDISSTTALHATHARAFPAADLDEKHRVQVGMLCFICSEVAFFGTLLVAYITFMGQDTTGPTPAEVLRWPLVIMGTHSTFDQQLYGPSGERRLRAGRMQAYYQWLAATIVLGIAFLVGTAAEWRELIFEDGLTIGTNLFGTTYFTLVGFHALHVTGGVVLLSLMFALAVRHVHPATPCRFRSC